ncbi:MAG: LCP family protein [Oscillospiraceae bacterium]
MSQQQSGHGPSSRPQKPLYDQDARPHKADGSATSRPAPVRQVYRAGGTTRPPANRPPVHTPAARRPAAPKKPPKKRRRGRIVAIVCLCLVLVIAGGLFTGYTLLANQISGEKTEAGELLPENKTETIPEYTGKNIICGLICGIDYDAPTGDSFLTEDKIGNTDLILYLMYDTEKNVPHLLQIPRDTYVGDHLSTGNSVKINSLYRNAEDTNNRMAALADVLYDQLGLPTDFYITIDMDGVKEIIDIVNATGEFLVYVPGDIEHPDYPGQVLEKGWRAFTGSEADFFLRNRNYADQDVSRLQTQQYFYSALFREFKQLAPSDLLMWMKVLLYRVKVGGISPLEIGGLAQKALGVQGQDIVFVRPPVTGAWYGDEQLVALVPDETADLLNEYFRPEGHSLSVDELDIYTLPVDPVVGKAEASVRSMSEIQATEGD